MRIFTIGLSIALLLSGCARPLWQDVGGEYTDASQGFAVTLPVGWKKLSTANNGVIVITRDGFLLQMIAIFRNPIDKELEFTKKKLSKGMLPQEAAEVIKDNLTSSPTMSNIEFIEESPATVGGYPGFKLVYQYQPRSGLMVKVIKYGVIQGDWYYNLYYAAPARNYFDKDVATFEKIKDFFRVAAQ